MVNKWLIMLSLCCALVVHAQDSTIEQLDGLERQRVLLEKQLEVSRLQKDLNDVRGSSNASPMVATGDLQSSSLHLIKVVGLASKPKAVFLYNGYRISAVRGEMVLPNMQLRNVNDTYVTVTDKTTGQDNILWLSGMTGEK